VAGVQTKQIKVDLHYIGWSSRYDCRMPLDQDHIRIAPPDIFSAVQNGKGAFHKVRRKESEKGDRLLDACVVSPFFGHPHAAATGKSQ
jgi:hypothetical protein